MDPRGFRTPICIVLLRCRTRNCTSPRRDRRRRSCHVQGKQSLQPGQGLHTSVWGRTDNDIVLRVAFLFFLGGPECTGEAIPTQIPTSSICLLIQSVVNSQPLVFFGGVFGTARGPSSFRLWLSLPGKFFEVARRSAPTE